MKNPTCCGVPMVQLAFLGGGERWGCKSCKTMVVEGDGVPKIDRSLPPDLEEALDELREAREAE